MPYNPPTSMEEYERRFMANSHVTGYGPEEVTQHMACPFCAAPEFDATRIIDYQQTRDRTCSHCGRSGRFVIERDAAGSLTAEFVQIGGDDPPEWLQPPPRRVDA